MGTTTPVSVPITAQIYDDSGGIATIDAMLGIENAPGDGLTSVFLDGPAGHNMTCVKTTSTVSTCTGTAAVHPTQLSNASTAPTWLRISGYAADGGSYFESTQYPEYADLPGATVPLLKQTTLTVNASPEPVAKGGKLTVTGRLTRATSDGATTFVGYGGQPVKLQFRKYNSSTYTTVKTVYTDSAGYLKTTTTANVAGYWRWSYAGSATVASVNASGDYVALK